MAGRKGLAGESAGASIIEAARAHLSGKETKVIEVPEWGQDGEAGAPLLIYASPMTLAEKARIYRTAKRDNLLALAMVLIIKACDAEGNKLFTLEHKRALTHEVDGDVLARVAREIAGGDLDEEDDEDLDRD